jgi:UDP-N-acetylmuramoyl-tripeptide--D-alanyl-D-alanine ligase
VILAGNEFRDVRGSYNWFESSEQATAYVRNHPPVNAAILIKGSRGSKMELLVDALKSQAD